MLSCSVLFNPLQPPGLQPVGSSVHGISQARILEWAAIAFSRGSSWPRALTWISCIGRQILYNWYHLGSQISSCLAGMYHRENCRVEKHKSKHNKVVHRKLKSFHTNWFLLWFTSNCEFFLNSSDLRGLDQLLIPLQCWIPEYTRPTSSKLFWA